MDHGVIDLSYGQIAIASLLVILNAAISMAMHLGIARRLLLGAARMVVQLLLVGFILRWVFASRKLYFVLPVMLTMSLIAGFAAVQRSGRRYPGVWLNSIVSIFFSSWAMIAIALFLILRVRPWYTPQYAIPFMGMILGNSISGVSLALDRLGEELTTHRNQVETLLALGATRWEAARLPLRSAVSTGMIPTINVMVVAGIVTLPGTMTGQLIAGTDPVTAVKYQIVIMFLLVSGTALATVGTVLLSFNRLFTPSHQFFYWRINERKQAKALAK
jgi:putative ABC transport system permease protein